jgi:hypothetical protein
LRRAWNSTALSHQTVVELFHQEVFLGHDVHRVTTETLGVGLKTLHGENVLFEVERRWRQVDETVLFLKLLVNLIDEPACFGGEAQDLVGLARE